MQPEQSQQIWLEHDKQPTYQLLDEPELESGLETKLAALETLQASDLTRSQQSYEPSKVLRLEPEYGDERPLDRYDQSDIGLARFITRPSKLTTSARSLPPADYLRDSWSSQPRYSVEEPNENEIESAQLRELLNDENAFVNSLALLDSNSGVSFDEDNATFSDIKTPSYTPLAEQEKLSSEKSAVEKDYESADQARRANTTSETKPRQAPPSSTLLEDEDLVARGELAHGINGLREPIFYGSVLDSKSATNLGFLNGLTSVFDRVYEKLASYLPSFSTGGHKNQDQVSKATIKKAGSGEASGASSASELSQTPAKQEVSELSGESSKKIPASPDINKHQKNQDKKSTINDKRQNEATITQGSSGRPRGETGSSDADEDLLAVASEPEHSYETSSTIKDSSALSLGNRYLGSAASSGSTQGGFKIDSGARVEKGDGVTKYIYAPEHHIHLNSGKLSKKASTGNSAFDDDSLDDLDEDLNSFPAKKIASLHRAHTRHFKPGDPIYGSYFSSPGPHLIDQEIASSKSNDFYFLVMVAAFCAMAMAVVLAAGLFAYRIQQNRATSADSDYPTYGVVGPNNMSAKCGGAASFVGGYFSSVHAQTQASGIASGASTKSAKLTISDSASAGAVSDSGIMSSANGTTCGVKSMLGKRAASMADQMVGSHSGGPGKATANYLGNQNAARMYHYQHQKQQMIISDHNSARGRHTSASDLDSEDENDDGSYTVYECPGLASAHEMEIKNPLFNDDRTP